MFIFDLFYIFLVYLYDRSIGKLFLKEYVFELIIVCCVLGVVGTLYFLLHNNQVQIYNRQCNEIGFTYVQTGTTMCLLTDNTGKVIKYKDLLDSDIVLKEYNKK